MTRSPGVQESLLGAESAAPKPEPLALVSAPATGILVTNHQNLMYMLAAGLLMPPAGFAGKHYRDTLSEFPGWLPVFVGHGRKAAKAPRAAIDEAVAEADHLKPVLLEVGLAGLRGRVHAFRSGGWAERRLEEGIAPEESLLLVPAPLPAGRIEAILFRTAAERKEVEVFAGERSNVPLAAFMQKTAGKRFSGDAGFAWPPRGGPVAREVALPAAQATGGVMAVLQQLANAGELSVQVCRAAFDPASAPPGDAILKGLPGWLNRVGGVPPAGGRGSGSGPRDPGTDVSANRHPVGAPAKPEEDRGRSPAMVGDREAAGGPSGGELFWGAARRLVESRGTFEPRRPGDVLIDFLRESSEALDPEPRARAAGLVSTLESLGGGLGGGSISEMLKQHRTPLSRAAILFLLREKTADLLELVGDYPQLEERDRLAAGILFGVRDGWLKLPVALRGPPESTAAVTHRMATLAHRLDESGFDLGEAPPRVQPLRELFAGPETWEAKRERAAVRLARGMKWSCVRTRVSLGKGTYEFRVEGGSAHIDFEGEPRVAAKVDRERFLAYLARDRVDPRVDAAVRNELGV